MRSAIVFVLLLGMAGLFGVLQTNRKLAVHRSQPVKGKTGTGVVAPGRDPSGKVAATKSGGRASVEAAPKKAPKKALPPRLSRPLRVAALGWELIAPGVVQNGGAQPGPSSRFSKERLQVHLMAFHKMEELEAALARGGADLAGADIAILPMPELCASAERLRALSPQVFLLLGWSSGHEAFLTARPGALSKPPRAGRVVLAAPRGTSAAFLGLFLLDLAGVGPERVTLLDPAVAFPAAPEPTRPARRPPPHYAALPRPTPSGLKLGDELKPLLTTADLHRLIPVVAIAPAGLLKQHAEALAAWGQVWMAGIEEMQRDVPAAARQVSALPQAPPALDLLTGLGQLEPASLPENARRFGLSGREPVTLEELFRRCWVLWRGSGLLSTPLPDRAPIHPDVIATMVRVYPTLVEAPPAPARASARPPASAEAAMELLVGYVPSPRPLEPSEALARIGFLAGVFERMDIKVSSRGGLGQARALVQGTLQRFELADPRRLHPAAHKKGPPLLLEVFATR